MSAGELTLKALQLLNAQGPQKTTQVAAHLGGPMGQASALLYALARAHRELVTRLSPRHHKPQLWGITAAGRAYVACDGKVPRAPRSPRPPPPPRLPPPLPPPPLPPLPDPPPGWVPTVTAWVLLALQDLVLTTREVARRLAITPQRATAWLHYVLLSGGVQRTTRLTAGRTLRAWALTPAGQTYRPPEVPV